jgi:hypothetical protein
VLLEGLGKLKNPNDLIGNRTRDLPACSIVPQQTTLPRAPEHTYNLINDHAKYLIESGSLVHNFSFYLLTTWKIIT